MVLTSLPVLWQNIPAESNLCKGGLTMAPSLSWWENQGSGNLRGLVLSHPLSGSKELRREPQFAFSIYTVHDPCTKEWCSPQSGGLPASINAIRIMPTRIRRTLSLMIIMSVKMTKFLSPWKQVLFILCSCVCGKCMDVHMFRGKMPMYVSLCAHVFEFVWGGPGLMEELILSLPEALVTEAVPVSQTCLVSLVSLLWRFLVSIF